MWHKTWGTGAFCSGIALNNQRGPETQDIVQIQQKMKCECSVFLH